MPVLYGIGVGPGDPELLTVKGLRLIRSAPVVFVPVRQAGAASFAGAIVESYLDRDAQDVVELEYPIVRDTARLRWAWQANADTIAARLHTAGRAVFLTEGDLLLYSTFLHTYAALRQRHPAVQVELVPGVTSFTAAAAAALPLALGDERIAIIPAVCDIAALQAALRDFDTVVFLKVSSAFDAVLDALEATGRVADAVWVRRVGRPEQEIVRDLRRLRGCRPDYFSLVIVRGAARGAAV